VLEKFTDGSRRVLVLAMEEAYLLGHSPVGTEHLLLGLIAEDKGVAAQALKSFDMSLTATRDRVEQMSGLTPTLNTAAPLSPGGKGYVVLHNQTEDAEPSVSTRVTKVFELSLRESTDLGHDYVGIEHLLLGLIREGGGMAMQVLRSFDVDGGDLRQRVIQLISDDRENTDGPSRSAPGPRCSGCGFPLSEVARFRTIEIQPSSTGPFPISIDVAFCIGCGLVFGSFRNKAPQ
jgi:ATP-dependent Clp protease ATP-binding subunit ClpC